MSREPDPVVHEGTDICLVYMPFAPIDPPPLGMALLTGGAKKAGLSIATMYPSFTFAESIGYFIYRAVLEAIGGFQIAEWTFSNAAFPDFRPDDEAFLREYLDSERLRDPDKFDLLFCDEVSFREMLRRLRTAADAFIDELARTIADRRPGIVGCSSTYYQNCASLALLRRLKELNPGTITMMGGANCEGSMGMVIKRAFPWVDVVVSGEADELFVPLCLRLLDAGAGALQQECPASVFTSSHKGNVSADDASVAMVTELDDLPLPDYSEYFRERAMFSYETVLSAAGLSIETSRGCWWAADASVRSAVATARESRTEPRALAVCCGRSTRSAASTRWAGSSRPTTSLRLPISPACSVLLPARTRRNTRSSSQSRPT